MDLNNSLNRWLIFLKENNEKLLEEVASMDKNIAKAENKSKHLQSDSIIKDAYDRRARELSDETTRIEGAKEEGRNEGRKEKTEEFISKLREKGFDDKFIDEIVGNNNDKT